jgi:SAM-dependent methyltransferase
MPDFDRLYAEDADPWQVASSWYEQRKIEVLLASLLRARYECSWDAACGTGELAARLAARSEQVLATDASPAAAELTRRRCAGLSQVQVAVSALPDRPAGLVGHPDLVVLSEVLYYLDEAARRDAWQLMDQVCGPDTEVVAVHWRLRPEGALITGAAAQRELNEHLVDRWWVRLVTHTDEEFVLGVWSQQPDRPFGR